MYEITTAVICSATFAISGLPIPADPFFMNFVPSPVVIRFADIVNVHKFKTAWKSCFIRCLEGVLVVARNLPMGGNHLSTQVTRNVSKL